MWEEHPFCCNVVGHHLASHPYHCGKVSLCYWVHLSLLQWSCWERYLSSCLQDEFYVSWYLILYHVAMIPRDAGKILRILFSLIWYHWEGLLREPTYVWICEYCCYLSRIQKNSLVGDVFRFPRSRTAQLKRLRLRGRGILSLPDQTKLS